MPYYGGGDLKFEEISLIPISENCCHGCWEFNVIQVITSITTDVKIFFIMRYANYKMT
jgi:hypothetical protein